MRGVKAIGGISEIKAGKMVTFYVKTWHRNTPKEDKHLLKWDLYEIIDGKFIKLKTFTKGKLQFSEKEIGKQYLLVGYLYEPELHNASAMKIHVVPTEKSQILSVEVLDINGQKITKPLAYGQKIKVNVRTTGLQGAKLNIDLWEDDATGSGHNDNNTKVTVASQLVAVGKNGIATTEILIPLNFKKYAEAHSNSGGEGKTHEYYVTAYHDGTVRVASGNVNFENTKTPTQRKQETRDHLENKPKKEEKAPGYKGKVPKTPPSHPATPAHKPPVQHPTKQAPVHQPPAQQPKQQQPAHPQPAPHQPAPAPAKKGITSVYLTDENGRSINSTMHKGVIKVHILSTGLIGKMIRFRLIEEDTLENDEIINQKFKIDKDHYIIDVTLKNVSRQKGEDHVGSGIFYTNLEDDEQEFFADIEVLDTQAHIKSAVVDVDVKAIKQDIPTNVTKLKVEKQEAKKEKFKPVEGNGEEAVIYITSEIATEIKIDENGDITSYPDYGAYNGQDEFYYGGKLYCKEILIKGKKKSAFPTFKAYIYRGNTVGEAVKKLKQDIKFNTHENAEDTVLEIARHSAKNLNYNKSGPIPPNTLDNLYRIKYSKAENKKHKVSYRYRIVDNNSTNFPIIKNFKDEYVNGAMNLGARTSISIDPWLSDNLEGCIGLRGKGGINHPSCEDTIKKQDKENYKYIYHSINNYLEGIIPELTGVYGRRGFSSSIGTETVKESTYKEEINVYVLADHLPDIDECGLFVDNRKLYYKSFGSKAVKYMEKNSTANKFKALYMVGQRRAENGFRLKTKGNNPLNITGKGDLGIVEYDTHETINGKYISRKGKFANFSSEDAGFKGYLNLLENNFNDAYKALFDNNLTIDDFTTGLQDTGKKGVYATGKARKNLSATEAYKADVKTYFEGAKNDYIKIYECLIKKSKDNKIKKQLQTDLELIKEVK